MKVGSLDQLQDWRLKNNIYTISKRFSSQTQGTIFVSIHVLSVGTSTESRNTQYHSHQYPWVVRIDIHAYREVSKAACFLLYVHEVLTEENLAAGIC